MSIRTTDDDSLFSAGAVIYVFVFYPIKCLCSILSPTTTRDSKLSSSSRGKKEATKSSEIERKEARVACVSLAGLLFEMMMDACSRVVFFFFEMERERERKFLKMRRKRM